MAHEIETSERINNGYSTATAYNYTRSSPLCVVKEGSVVAVRPEGLRRVLIEKRGRAGSVHTVEDKYGWRPPTAYWGYEWTRHGPGLVAFTRDDKTTTAGCTGRYVYKHTLATGGEGGLSCPVSSAPTVSTALRDAAKTSALSKFSGKAVDLSVAFGERKATANGIVSIIKDVANIARKVRRRDWSLPKSIKDGRAFPERWLEYRYGWSPLLSDAKGMLLALEKADDGTYEKYIVGVYSMKRERTETVTSVNFSANFGAGTTYPPSTGVSWWVPGTIRKTTEASCFVRLDATMKDVTYVRLNDVGVIDPLSTVWELLPYSFVVDWFLNVGEYLAAVNGAGLYQFLGGSETLRNKTFWDHRPLGPYSPSESLTQTMTGYNVTRNKCFVRIPMGGMPSPTWAVKNPLSLNHFADAMSLLIQAMTGKKNKKTVTWVDRVQKITDGDRSHHY